MSKYIKTLALAVAFLSWTSISYASLILEVEPNDTLAGAQDVNGGFSIGGDPLDVGAAAGTGWVSISGTGNGSYDYYSFFAQAGDSVILDIDNAQDISWDLEMFLYDSAGTDLAGNDDTFGPDPNGSTGTGGFDPYIPYNVASAGSYVIGVCAFSCAGPNGGITGSTVPTGASYDLQISGVSVPEPVTMTLFGLGLAGLGLVSRRRRS